MNTYFTFDIDGIDPTFAPGTGTPEVGGFSVREAQLIIRALNKLNYIGGDVNGGMPTIDQLFTRPTWRTYRTPNKRIYLCSAATPPGGGIHGMCGHFAAEAVLNDWRD